MKSVMNRSIKKYNLLKEQDCIIAAISGGADSKAMLDVLNGLKQRMNLTVIVAHVNHQKRSNSKLEEQLVQEIAKKYHMPFEVLYLSKSKTTTNFHAYAREERYKFFAQLAEKYHANKIATAHHLDDQLETFVHRMLYYRSLSMLRGINPCVDYETYSIIRPLYECTKKEIYQYCQDYYVRFMEDESNESDEYTRNRIRHHIVPPLVAESATVYDNVLSLTHQITEDERYFQAEVLKLKELVTIKGDEITFSRNWMNGLAYSLSSRLLHDLLQSMTTEMILHVHVQSVLELCKRTKPNLQLTLIENLCCLVEYDNVILSKRLMAEKTYEISLQVDSIVDLPNGQSMSLTQHKECEKTEKYCITEVYLCYNELDLPYKVRCRKPGDKIQLFNGSGHKKVKEIMIEAKIPKRQRAQWPIVVNNKDEIVWIPLLKKSNVCQLKPNKDYIKIKLHYSEG